MKKYFIFLIMLFTFCIIFILCNQDDVPNTSDHIKECFEFNKRTYNINIVKNKLVGEWKMPDVDSSIVINDNGLAFILNGIEIIQKTSYKLSIKKNS